MLSIINQRVILIGLPQAPASLEWETLYQKYYLSLAYNLQKPPTNGKQGLGPEEMSQTLLAGRKQGNYD
jgi:hypothetical protein